MAPPRLGYLILTTSPEEDTAMIPHFIPEGLQGWRSKLLSQGTHGLVVVKTKFLN
jgi:hypothetical protein